MANIFENAAKGTTVKTPTRGSKVQVRCEAPGCRKLFMARKADRDRGWGRFCSKTCKAREQEQRTGQHAKHAKKVRKAQQNEHNYLGSGVDRETYMYYKNEYGGIPQFNRRGVYEGFVMSMEDLSHGGYNNADHDDPLGDGKW